MNKKLHIIDYLIILSIIAFTIYFVNQVNEGFKSEPKQTTYPSTITIDIQDSKAVLTTIKKGNRLAESKAFVAGSVQDIEIRPSDEDDLFIARIIIKADLTKSGPNYKLKSKDIKVARDLIFETDLHYLTATIVDLEIGDANEK